MLTRFFAYGTLELPAIMEHVCGQRLPHRAATLRGYARFLLLDRCYPAVVASAASSVDGVLFEQVESVMLDRLDVYEGEQYLRRALTVETESGPLQAWVYVLKDEYTGLLGTLPWDRATFETQHYARFMASLGA